MHSFGSRLAIRNRSHIRMRQNRSPASVTGYLHVCSSAAEKVHSRAKFIGTTVAVLYAIDHVYVTSMG